jgi:putative phosphoribosyl transferase
MFSHSDWPTPYRDRRHAGQELAEHLDDLKGRNDVVVLALPRGGVPVAFEVARALGAPLDVFLVRKLGVPGHAEFAMGAVAPGGVRVLSDDVVMMLGISASEIEAVTAAERKELDRRERLYRAGRKAVELRNRVAILIDDGLATGSTMKAAVQALRAYGPARVVVAVPVGSPETCREFADIADEIVCARSPHPFRAVGQWYQDFSQTTDDEVQELLEQVRDRKEAQKVP